MLPALHRLTLVPPVTGGNSGGGGQIKQSERELESVSCVIRIRMKGVCVWVQYQYVLCEPPVL